MPQGELPQQPTNPPNTPDPAPRVPEFVGHDDQYANTQPPADARQGEGAPQAQPGAGNTGGTEPPPDEGQSRPAWFTDELAQQAAMYGLAPDQAGNYRDADALRNAMLGFDQQMYRAGLEAQAARDQQIRQQQYQQWQQWQQQPQFPPQQFAPPPPPQPWQQPWPQTQQQVPQQQPLPQQPPQVAPLNFEGITADGFGEELVGAFGTVADRFNHLSGAVAEQMQINQGLVQYVGQLQAAMAAQVQQMQAARVQEEVSRAISGLGESYGKILGNGQVAQGTPQGNNRARLMQTIGVIVDGYVNRGMQPPPLQVLVRNAANLAFPNETQQIAREEMRRQGQNYANGFTQRPVSRNTQRPEGNGGYDAAIDIQRRFWAERGLNVNEYADNESESLL